jgi:hypothetical protein
MASTVSDGRASSVFSREEEVFAYRYPQLIRPTDGEELRCNRSSCLRL